MNEVEVSAYSSGAYMDVRTPPFRFIYRVLVSQTPGFNGVQREFRTVEAASIVEASRHGIVVLLLGSL